MTRRITAALMALMLLSSQLMHTAAAQNFSTDIDIDPPVIDHEALETGVAGEVQTFKAGVIDDRGLQRVSLFYRDRSGAQYQSVEMRLEPSQTDTTNYLATIATNPDQKRIEYYIEALDTGGNRVLKGFPFFPLVRMLDPPPQPEPQPVANKSNGIIYVALGAVAAIVLALALSGGGDNDAPPEGEDGDVPLTIEVNPP